MGTNSIMSAETIDLERVERDDRAGRLRWARENAGFKTAGAASSKCGWNRNTYKAHESGRIGFPTAIGRDYAKRFSVSFGWLMTGDGTPEPGMLIPIVGYIGAGEEIFSIDDVAMGGGSLDETIFAPPGLRPEAVGVIVRGDSMYPDLDPDDVIVYDRRYEADIEKFLGRRVVVGLTDGRRFVKRLRTGKRSGLYNLESSDKRTALIENVKVQWVAPIAWIKPRW